MPSGNVMEVFRIREHFPGETIIDPDHKISGNRYDMRKDHGLNLMQYRIDEIYKKEYLFNKPEFE
jgi:hypothetical protein